MMKVGMSLAVMALVGQISAEEIHNMKHSGHRHTHKLRQLHTQQEFHVDDQGFIVLGAVHHKREKPSNEVANGDEKEDQEVSDTDDEHDHNVQDYGFGVDAHRHVLKSNLKLQTGMKVGVLPSDEVANGDIDENKELSDTDDEDDHNVQDMGFGVEAHRNLIPRRDDAILQTASKNMKKHKKKSKLRQRDPESDQTANGDIDDNKEISDTDDEDDHNVQDMGFGVNAHRNLIPRKESAIVQLKELPSNEVANGDIDEDRELSDTDDEDDHNVQDMGFGVNAHRNLIPRADDAIVQLKSQTKQKLKVKELPSNEVANGDIDEDRELSDTDDENDHNVQDMGFGVNAHRNLIPRADDAIVQLKSQVKIKELPSNEVANGDVDEDRELSDTDDEDDHNVQDMGFGVEAHRNLIPRADSAIVQLKSQVRLGELPSNEVANGDVDEDRELSDTDDENDHNVQDYGFGVESHRNLIPRADTSIVQLNSQVKLGELPSNEVANGDVDENRELSDTDDEDDHNVQDMGFGVEAHRNLIPRKDDAILQTKDDIPVFKKQQNRLAQRLKKHKVNYSDDVANGDEQDDLELEDDTDRNDYVVDENSGFIQLGNTIHLHKKPKGVRMINDMNVQLQRYSDELANGDTADDRDIHEDEDMNDDVVDVNGQTNRGYGHQVPSAYEAGNAPGNFGLLQLEEEHSISDGHYMKDITRFVQQAKSTAL